MAARPPFCTGFGQSDTHAITLSDGRRNPSQSAGAPYSTISASDVAATLTNPPSVPKEQAQWIIPSAYIAQDARNHQRQREAGTFWALAADVDQGNHSLQDVVAAVVAVAGNASRAVYSSRGATADNRKWRVLLPLAAAVTGANYGDTAAAFFALLSEHGVNCDAALTRAAQLVYLPNRGGFYEYDLNRATRLTLTSDHPIIKRRDSIRQAHTRAQQDADARRRKRAAEREADSIHDESPVDAYNARHDLGDTLLHYGWTQLRHSRDYRSPFQTSGSYATRIMGDGADAMWVSLSASDAAQGVGMATQSGATAGDAFDLYCHFEHGGDFTEAVRAYGAEVRQEAGAPGGDSWTGFNDANPRAPGGKAGGTDNDANGPHTAASDWPEPDARYLSDYILPPPPLPLRDVLGPTAADWVERTTEGAGAPPDYVLAALLSSVSSIVGNARWVSPWQGWAEPPLIWSMCIGLPSAGKSPAIEAVLSGVRRTEKPIRQAAQAEYETWERKAKLAKLAEQAWEAKSRKALEKGQTPPPMPDEAKPGPPPHIPRLIVNDGTVEKIGVIAAAQPKGVLQFRDELAGWLLTMETRNGGSDRAFWLEGYGGRSFTVERMSRAPLSIDRLTIGVLGGIQPDRLNDLLRKASDDGLVARFMPIWPAPAPVRRPTRFAEDATADAAWRKLLALDMPSDEYGELRPWFAAFDPEAALLMDQWREQCRAWELDTTGLLASHIGKLPGLAARLALVLASIDHGFDKAPQPNVISPDHFGRACHFLQEYALPMARRCYAAASVPIAEKAAHRLLWIIRQNRWASFTTRQAMRSDRPLLGNEAKLAAAIRALEEGDCIRATLAPRGPKGGRPQRAYDVNPALLAYTI